MKKLLNSLLSLVLLVAFMIQPRPVAAGPANQTAVLTFPDLGITEEIVLHGPYDLRDIRFDLPATWVLQPGAMLELEITSFFVGNNVKIANNYLGAVLNVSFNNHLQESIPLESGEKIIHQVPIATENLVSPYADGSHLLSFYLDAGIDCDFDFHSTTVILTLNSKISFPYRESSLGLDLRRLPWPFYLQRGKVVDPVTVVLPKSPTAQELQSALVVMCSFGKMTKGKLSLAGITDDQLTPDIQKQSNLIFVGKASVFAALQGLEFPVPLAGGLFSSPVLNQDDGVVQTILSPWNNSRVILLISGNTDLGVVKAAQALSTSNLQTGKSLNYSIIAQVNPYPAEVPADKNTTLSPSADTKFSDLGYDFVTATGMGSQWVRYQFTIPAGQVAAAGAYMILNISPSTVVDPNRSEGVVYLNGIQIGSVSLSPGTSSQVSVKVDLPLSAFKTGLNLIDIVFNMFPKNECSLYNFASLWITISPDSLLHLPLSQEITQAGTQPLKDLKAYPYPFTNDPSLSTTVFVLSGQDPSSWLVAEKVAYDLGTRVTSSILGFQAAFDGQLSADQKANNLILIGQPRNYTMLAELQASMPASYQEGSNLAVLESQQVIYRFAEDKSLGYLQLFISPYNPDAAVLGIFGTDPQGLEYAVNALLDPNTRTGLAGNFATLDGTQALVADTRTGAGLGSLTSGLGVAVTQEPAPIPTPLPVAAPASAQNNRQFMFIAILVVLAIILVTAVLAFGLRRKRS